ncbi:TetR/AcrR family transcriptional regulator [Salinibacterium sp. NK8237]|uniref:TetR/AcrR family transcriptional regulator n=1 Tax=Salinibacterium sp. NK8237 TaxID=2792038 RepID=UPI0018CD508B|nr:TetR/AcrR family transcriptional regulator C-terminal domain-containing protein [Salinibacterium sp. NK8237]MBH0129991.1 TetR/AcrR family transcriptional regulator C-terminal domain-containing protein [Salinibacterium sp. NK8237]
MSRPKVALLSTDRIADAALALVDSGAPFGVNALARKLGVTPSSLYNHVDGKDAIIELMRARVVADHMPTHVYKSWDHAVVEIMRQQRAMYAAHPALVPLIVGKTITDAHAIEHYDQLATALVEAGFSNDEVLSLVAVLDAFAIGFGLDLTSPEAIWQPSGSTHTLGKLIENSAGGAARSDAAFELGLELLLGALHARLNGAASRTAQVTPAAGADSPD